MRKILMSLVLAAGLVVTGCSSDDGGDAKASEVIPVKVANMVYSPANLTIKVGQTVEWTFDDNGLLHDVVGDDGLKSDLVATGTYRHTFTKVGTFKYLCSVHPMMTGTVTVTA
ncbi:plastocyanin/azurin family copper-binding protein [Actinocorallia sp. A-T 12471]|uniref:plastocyanin/azurin family copper-binding protein n=1 Tax=Actinocorallia sp. A-T 12471 TaxID=3089813 RepID=UPI0029CC3349|nr:plastocyanin/azurin family copper-binding protein [Actinocorallia sp. A-T 12471]MDX6739549.1 cupredoxin domain-containing protein [Actinocorallia sp. A-T 12471]